MDSAIINGIVTDALVLLLLLSAPILSAALLSGVIAGLLATYTKLSDPAIGTMARVIAVVGTVVLIAPWLGGRLVSFASQTWSLIGNAVQ